MNSNRTIEVTTIAAAIDGDPSSLRIVLEELLTWLPHTTRRLYGKNFDPEELTQDTLMIVVRRISTLQSPQKLNSWVMGILRRVARNHYRKRQRIPLLFEEEYPHKEGAFSPAAESPEQLAWRREAQRIGDEILQKLDDGARETYILHLDGWSVTEISEIMGVPRGTGASRLKRAKQKILEYSQTTRLSQRNPL